MRRYDAPSWMTARSSSEPTRPTSGFDLAERPGDELLRDGRDLRPRARLSDGGRVMLRRPRGESGSRRFARATSSHSRTSGWERLPDRPSTSPRAWDGSRVWRSLADELRVNATCDSLGHVTLTVTLPQPRAQAVEAGPGPPRQPSDRPPGGPQRARTKTDCLVRPRLGLVTEAIARHLPGEERRRRSTPSGRSRAASTGVGSAWFARRQGADDVVVGTGSMSSYAISGDARLAFSVRAGGPHVIVRVPAWISNQDLENLESG